MPALARGLAASPRDPRLKLFVTWRSLQFRRSHAELFSAGRYVPLVVQGTRAKNVCAFAWQSGPSETVSTSDAENVVIAVAPRLVAQLLSPGNFEGPSAPPETVWLDTVLDLPPFALGKFKDAFTEQTRQFDRPYANLADLLADLPLALLEKTGGDG
jgi:(1->4)-alpha-D-glucan 1-alpha-D-glucosylmutase